MSDFLLIHRIENTHAAVGNWSKARIEAGSKADSIVPDAMATFLRNCQYPHVVDRDTMTNVLMSYVLLRAMEQTEQIIVETDEDGVSTVTGRYDDRQRIFLHCLTDLVRATPLKIAEDSQWALGGQGLTQERRGWETKAVQEAWTAIRNAVAPFSYQTAIQEHYRR